MEGRIGEGKINWNELGKAVQLGVRFLDNIIDYNPYHDKRNEIAQKSTRRIGLGTLGLGEALIKMGKKYGKESLTTIEQIYKFIAIKSYKASIDLAEEKGAFSNFDYNKYVLSDFMKKMYPCLTKEYQEKLRKTGIRNVTLNTAAPK